MSTFCFQRLFKTLKLSRVEIGNSEVNIFPLLPGYSQSKALSKQEGPNICWDAHFLNPFFEVEFAAAAKKKD